MMALDVPWDTIASEYMLSNTYRQEESNARIKALNELAERNPDVVDKAKNLENIKAFYQLNENYIKGTKKAVENEYGSIQNYLNSIGVNSADIAKVKNNLLK